MYTDTMRQSVRAIEKPKGLDFRMDVASTTEQITLLVYEHEVMRYPEIDRYLIMDYLNRVRRCLQEQGVKVNIVGRPNK
jgi:hypothetical protein